MILVKNHIQTGFSIEDAEILDRVINKEIETNDIVIIDFSDISFFTTLFFNNALTKYILTLTPTVYDKKFEIINLSDVGSSTYEHSYNNAIEYYNLPPEKRDVHEQIIKNGGWITMRCLKCLLII